MPHLLVVDDEPNIAYTIGETLGSDELHVVSALTAREGIDAVRRYRPAVVLLDVRLPDMSGLDAFEQMHKIDPRIPVIIMTAFARTDTAIEATRRGAFDYFIKPVDFAALRQSVSRALATRRLTNVPALVEADADETAVEGAADADRIVGRSAPMQEIYKTIGRVAPQDVTVLLLGESGTGKELVARAIYHYSRRGKLPFLAVNCAALSESLLESELFGHEKGAFTGADHRRIGKFEQVNGGTIFLDEIGDMSPSTQAKALRLLQQQQFERVGGNETIQTDVRIIAATNKDLGAMVAEGKFRQDLYYRLSGFTMHLPPLRERREDIPLMTDYFVRSISRELGKPVRGVTESVRGILQRHDWPGNVRELHSAIRYAVVHATGGVVTDDCLPVSCRHGEALPPATATHGITPDAAQLPSVRLLVQQLWNAGSRDIYRDVVQAVDRAVIDEVLRSTGGNQVQAAERLGISRVTLRSKMRAVRPDTGED